MNTKDIASLVRTIHQRCEDAFKEYERVKTPMNFEYWKGMSDLKSLVIAWVQKREARPVPRIRMDDLPCEGQDMAEWTENIRKKYPDVWRLELHEDMGLHWNLNDEDPPNTLGFRTVLTCSDSELDEVDARASSVYERLMLENGEVDYVEFYKAMNDEQV